MATAADVIGQGAAPAQLTTEQKILQASAEAAQITSLFSPAASQAIQLGVAVEPVISSIVGLFRNIFHHKMGVAAPAPPVTQ